MAQEVNNTPQQTGAVKSIGDIISALKSSIGIGGAESNMFANLLSETNKAMPKIEVREAPKQTAAHEPVKAEASQEEQKPAYEKAEMRSNDERHDEKRSSEVKSDEAKDVQAASEAPKGEVEKALKALETQMAEVMDVAGDHASDVDLEAELVALQADGEDAVTYEKATEFLGALFPEKKQEDLKPLVDEILAKVEATDNAEELTAEELLALAARMLEDKLAAGRSEGDALAAKKSAEAKALTGENADELTQALAKIAEQISLLKEARGNHEAKGLDVQMASLAGEGAGEAEEGVWQKMVQEVRMESLGRKDGQAHVFGAEAKPDMVAEGAKNAPVNLGPQVASAVAAVKASEVPAPQAPTQNASATPNVQGATGLEAGRTAGTYDIAGQLSAAREVKGGTTGLPKVIEQVSVQLHKAVKNGQTEMTLNLKPAELGKVEIKLVFGEGKTVTGVVMAENQASLNLLQKDSDALVRALQEAGLDTDKSSMEFSLKDEGNASAHAHGQKDHGAKGQKTFGIVQEAGVIGDDMPEVGAEAYYVEPGRVNISV